MRNIQRTSLPLLLIVLGVLACGLPDIIPVSQVVDATSVAQTVVAAVKLTQEAAGTSFEVSDTPLATLTSSATATLTLTPTATFTLTPTIPVFPMISVSIPTNCRNGPGKAYEMVGALLVGETVQVYARDPSNNYWYIKNPDSPSEFCWVWGEYATLSGLVTILPVFTPPPTPSPTFTATPAPAFDPSFGGLEYCSGWWVDIDLENTGSLTFRSVSLTVEDTDTSTVLTDIEDEFIDQTGCSSTTTRKSLAPGKTIGHSSPKFSYDITGHKLKTTVTLCDDTGLNGTCVTETLTFRP